MAAVRVEGLTKRFDTVTAIDALDLVVEEGEVFGFLGPNGAGKSTVINILLDFVRPTSGTATVLGHDTRAESTAIRSRTGVLPDDYGVYTKLSGRQHVQYRIDAKGASDDPGTILDRVGLREDADRKAGEYSRGMTQRLVLGMALVGAPDLLILDEPTTGLDPNGARQLREIVREEVDRGATVLFSSHRLGQVEEICDRVGILRDGQLVAVDSIEELETSSEQQDTLTVSVDRIPTGIVDRIEGVEGVDSVTIEESSNELSVQADESARSTVITTLESAGVSVETFEIHEASLETLFAAYTTDRMENVEPDQPASGDDR